MKYKLVKTCGACPEQYDVFDDSGHQVAYFRLRHGCFTVDVPCHNTETIYEEYPKGDGMFNDDERMFYLTEAINKVAEFYNVDHRDNTIEIVNGENE